MFKMFKSFKLLAASLMFLTMFSAPASATFLKPLYYVDQCAEMSYELAANYDKVILEDFEYLPPRVVEYDNSNAIVDVTIILEQDRLVWNKTREVICGFNSDGMIVDYADPFDGDEYILDEPLFYELQAGDYVDVESSNCTAIMVTKEMANKAASGAAIGASMGVTGGIIAIPMSGGVLVAAGYGGGAVVGAAAGGIIGVGHSIYHCVTS